MGACKYGEFEMFLEAFMHSEYVQKRYTANMVKVGRLGKTTRVAHQDYGPVPIEMLDDHFISTEGASGYLIFKKSHKCWQLTHDLISEEN